MKQIKKTTFIGMLGIILIVSLFVCYLLSIIELKYKPELIYQKTETGQRQNTKFIASQKILNEQNPPKKVIKEIEPIKKAKYIPANKELLSKQKLKTNQEIIKNLEKALNENNGLEVLDLLILVGTRGNGVPMKILDYFGNITKTISMDTSLLPMLSNAIDDENINEVTRELLRLTLMSNPLPDANPYIAQKILNEENQKILKIYLLNLSPERIADTNIQRALMDAVIDVSKNSQENRLLALDLMKNIKNDDIENFFRYIKVNAQDPIIKERVNF